MLVPILGESGAVIAQYVITLGVVIGLIVLVVWGIRHFGGGAVRPAARGRLPRLAIVDTLPVDTKRKLILLRRDNVEHLILIGGPSDLVVEPSIVRQRVSQRAGQGTTVRPATGAHEAPAPAPASESLESYIAAPEPAQVVSPLPSRAPAAEPEAGESAIPFAPRRGTATFGERPEYRGTAERAVAERAAGDRVERQAPPRRESLRGTMQATAAPPPEAPRPYRTFTPSTNGPSRSVAAGSAPDPEAAPAVAARPIPLAARAESPPSRFAPPPVRSAVEDLPDGPVPGYEAPEVPDHDAVNAFAPHAALDDGDETSGPRDGDGFEVLDATLVAAESGLEDGRPDGETVGELEEEMARLLNQISTSRRE